MKVRYRTMQSTDVRACVEHLAAHAILGPRYGSDLKHFPSALFAVLGYDSAFARVFEEVQGSTTRFLGGHNSLVALVFEEVKARRPNFWGAGLGVFVSDDFLREVKINASFWVGPELVKRIASASLRLSLMPKFGGRMPRLG